MSVISKGAILSSIGLSVALSGCVGTDLPKFLSDAPEGCSFSVGANQYPLEGFSQLLANVTGLVCLDEPLENVDGIESLEKLTTLTLVNAGLTDLSGVQSLLLLEEVDVSKNSLSDINGLTDLPVLAKLDISDNNISTTDAMSAMQGLTSLNLANNQLAGDITELGALDKLVNLQLNGNPQIDCADISILESALETVDAPSIIVPPSHCASTIVLDTGSSESVDNNTQTPPFELLQIVGAESPDDITLIRIENDLRVELADGVSFVNFQGWFVDGSVPISLVSFGDGSEYTFAELQALIGIHITLTNQADEYTGSEFADIIDGLAGNDIIGGAGGRDTIIGGSGFDTLNGGAGDGDLLVGGYRDENGVHKGDSVPDTYLFNEGDGNDTIVDFDFLTSDQGHLTFGEGIGAEGVQLEREGDNLTIAVNGQDSVTVLNWYVDSDYRLSTFTFDGVAVSVVAYMGSHEVMGTDGEDIFDGTETSDILNGAGGDDVINGKAGNDWLLGGDNRDTIIGGSGFDTLNGGAGDGDLLVGGYRDENGMYTGDSVPDTYLFNEGDGNDTIVDFDFLTSDQGHLIFGEGIGAEDLQLEREGDNLTIVVNDQDSVTVLNWYVDSDYRLSTFTFDGVAVSVVAYMGSHEVVGTSGVDIFNGTASSDVINGAGGNDIIKGDAGNDELFGGGGQDTVIGGSGFDTLNGGAGDGDLLVGGYRDENGVYTGDSVPDTYLFNDGDGNDTIVDFDFLTSDQGHLIFGEGIGAEDVQLEREGDNLTIVVNDQDSVTVLNWYVDSDYRLSTFTFDGVAVSVVAYMGSHEVVGTSGVDIFNGTASSDVINGAGGDDVIDGKEGNDQLYGGGDQDTVIGGSGFDTLSGGEGNGDLLVGGHRDESGAYSGDGVPDTYLFNRGDGIDSIVDFDFLSSDRGHLIFGNGILVAETTLRREGDDLIFVTSSSDEVRIVNWYVDSDYQLATVTFSDSDAMNAVDFVESRMVSAN